MQEYLTEITKKKTFNKNTGKLKICIENKRLHLVKSLMICFISSRNLQSHLLLSLNEISLNVSKGCDKRNRNFY